MTSAPTSVRHRFGHFELQPEERRLLADGVVVRLGGHALDLLLVFVERSGRLISKDELLARVWHGVVVEENTLQSHIAALRKVLGTDAIATVSGRGYRFVPEVERADGISSNPNSSRKQNFPQQLTSFIGREKEIAQISRLMGSTRLLTLTGAGGCGKTRLALEVASQSIDAFTDGGWLVELAPLSDPSLVSQRIATALAVPEQPGRTLAESLVEWLTTKHLLLVLDNAEHLLAATCQLADLLLRQCPRLTIFVTARERLGISGELTYRVPSLSVPRADRVKAPMEALNCEATRLFVERARLVDPDFSITEKNVPALASICRRLDGIALAIELAAPRVRSMSLEELSRRLDDRFAVLTGGSPTALPRHRTLRSLVDWSHGLLTDSEKAMLRRVSVFAGGWTVEAAERVCCLDRIEQSDVLDLLTSLADKNLLTVDTVEEVTRFGFLETLREYALNQLRESSEEEALCGQHLDYCIGLAKFLSDPQRGDEERQVHLRLLDNEHANLRAALGWCGADASRSIKGLRLVGNLVYFWLTRGFYAEGRGWVDRFLTATPNGAGGEDRARACNCAANLSYQQNDYDACDAYNRAALAEWEQIGRRDKVAGTLGNLGITLVDRGNYAGARDLFERSVRESRQLGNLRSIVTPLRNLGTCAYEMGDLAKAEEWLLECLPLSLDQGAWTAGDVHGQLGLVRHARGDLQQARDHLTEALKSYREFGDKPWIANTLVALGVVSHDENDFESATTHLKEALGILQATRESKPLAQALEAYAGLTFELSGSLDAARLWGHAQLLRERIGAPQPLPDRQRSERQIAVARAALKDDAAFDLAWAEGRASPSADVLEIILSA